jgi:hypothetical protein
MSDVDRGSPVREIVLRAWTDPKFKMRFMENPKLVFAEFGLEVPNDARNIKVIENTDSEVYFVLPETPDLGALSDDQIKALVDSALGVQLVLPTILAR